MMIKPLTAFCGNTYCGHLASLVCMSLTITACSTGGIRDGAPATDRDISKIADATPRIEPRSKQGNPSSYSVFGKRYRVMDSAKDYVKQGTASWYGTKFHGRRTSSGEIYDMYKMTAAHKTLPLPSYVQVTNLDNERQIIVRVNDRGPFHQDRIIDLSYVAARKLGITANGTGEVEVRVINSALSTLSKTQASSPDTQTAALANTESLPAKKYFLQMGAFRLIRNAEQLYTQLSSATSRPVSISKAFKKTGDTLTQNDADSNITTSAESNTEESAENSAIKNNASLDNPALATPLYRVRLGPFPDREQTRHAANELSELGFDDSQLILE